MNKIMGLLILLGMLVSIAVYSWGDSGMSENDSYTYGTCMDICNVVEGRIGDENKSFRSRHEEKNGKISLFKCQCSDGKREFMVGWGKS